MLTFTPARAIVKPRPAGAKRLAGRPVQTIDAPAQLMPAQPVCKRGEP
ncbi:hypothetical protein [Burkholderia sp. 22313]